MGIVPCFSLFSFDSRLTLLVSGPFPFVSVRYLPLLIRFPLFSPMISGFPLFLATTRDVFKHYDFVELKGIEAVTCAV